MVNKTMYGEVPGTKILKDNILRELDTDDPSNTFDRQGFTRAMNIIRESIDDEREDEIFYSKILKEAPEEDRQIILPIIDDERKHNHYLKRIYRELGGQNYQRPIQRAERDRRRDNMDEEYLNDIQKAIFGELSAVERYRMVYNYMPNRVYRDILFEIITDELKHAAKYNFLYSKNKK